MKAQRSVVKWFDAKKGYGFILNPNQGPDIFVHYSQIVTDKRFKTLHTGEIVEYELHDGEKGPHAHNVKGTNEVVRPSVDPSLVVASLNQESSSLENLTQPLSVSTDSA